jgi:hypothetical protein
MRAIIHRHFAFNLTGYASTATVFEPGEQEVPAVVGAWLQANPSFGTLAASAENPQAPTEAEAEAEPAAAEESPPTRRRSR